MKPSEIFRKNALFLMKRLGWNKAALARESGNFDSVIGRYLSGANIPTIDAVEPIAKALGVTVGEILTDNDAKIESIRHVVMTPEQIADEVRQSLKKTRELVDTQAQALEKHERAIRKAHEIIRTSNGSTGPALHKVRRRVKKS